MNRESDMERALRLNGGEADRHAMLEALLTRAAANDRGAAPPGLEERLWAATAATLRDAARNGEAGRLVPNHQRVVRTGQVRSWWSPVRAAAGLGLAATLLAAVIAGRGSGTGLSEGGAGTTLTAADRERASITALEESLDALAALDGAYSQDLEALAIETGTWDAQMRAGVLDATLMSDEGAM